MKINTLKCINQLLKNKAERTTAVTQDARI
jgi:hypothetical protein